jgi:hypothetical protein
MSLWDWIDTVKIRNYRYQADNLDLFAIKAANKAISLRQDARQLEYNLTPERCTLEILAIPSGIQPLDIAVGGNTNQCQIKRL